MNQKMDSIKRVFSLCKIEIGKMYTSIVLSILGYIVSLVPFFVVYKVMTEMVNDTLTYESMLNYSLVAFSSIIAKVYFLAKSTELSHIVAYRVLHKLRLDVADKIVKLPLGYFNKTGAGELKKIMNEDIEKLEILIAHNIPEISGAVAAPLFTIVYIFFLDWRMGVGALLVVPLMFIGLKLMFSNVDSLMTAHYESSKKMNASILEYVNGMTVIKAFGRTMSSYENLTKSIRDFAKFSNKWSNDTVQYMSLVSVIAEVGVVTIFPFAMFLTYKGTIEPEMLLQILLLGFGYAMPLTKFMTFMGFFSQIAKGEEGIYQLLTEKELEVSSKKEIIDAYDICFKNVDFSYEDRKIIDDFSLKFNAGEITALIGPSGAGKTTIGRLIPRFWDVNSGAVEIGGKNIVDIDNENLMKNVSFVFQDVFLFNTSIKQNIKMGKIDATDEEIVEAAKLAQCHDFISKLELGYETPVGERAVKLSGGEKQRIALARAILKDAPIVIFDEATSAADPENEDKIQAALNKLIKGKTVIVIAHKLSTIVDADKIVIVDNGKAVDQGKHQDLLEKSAIYKNMWNAYNGIDEWILSGGENIA